MAQTLLQVCQQASREMGITAPATIIANTDLYAVQLLNLFNGLGQDLAREHDWQRLQTEYLFSTVFFGYTGTTTIDSTTLSVLSSTTGLTTNPTYFTVTGTGVRADSNLVSVNAGAATAVIGREASASGSLIALTFSQVKYAMPSDFDRLIDRTDWDKSRNWELGGPETPQEWQWLKSGNLASSTLTRFRVFGNLFVIFPPPTSERDMRFEYVSNLWGATSASAAPTLTALTADTDTNVFPDRLMVEGLKLRFRVDKGVAKERHTAQDIAAGFPLARLDTAKAADAGSPTLSLAPRRGSVLLGYDNVPEGDYGT